MRQVDGMKHSSFVASRWSRSGLSRSTGSCRTVAFVSVLVAVVVLVGVVMSGRLSLSLTASAADSQEPHWSDVAMANAKLNAVVNAQPARPLPQRASTRIERDTARVSSESRKRPESQLPDDDDTLLRAMLSPAEMVDQESAAASFRSFLQRSWGLFLVDAVYDERVFLEAVRHPNPIEGRISKRFVAEFDGDAGDWDATAQRLLYLKWSTSFALGVLHRDSTARAITLATRATSGESSPRGAHRSAAAAVAGRLRHLLAAYLRSLFLGLTLVVESMNDGERHQWSMLETVEHRGTHFGGHSALLVALCSIRSTSDVNEVSTTLRSMIGASAALRENTAKFLTAPVSPIEETFVFPVGARAYRAQNPAAQKFDYLFRPVIGCESSQKLCEEVDGCTSVCDLDVLVEDAAAESLDAQKKMLSFVALVNGPHNFRWEVSIVRRIGVARNRLLRIATGPPPSDDSAAHRRRSARRLSSPRNLPAISVRTISCAALAAPSEVVRAAALSPGVSVEVVPTKTVCSGLAMWPLGAKATLDYPRVLEVLRGVPRSSSSSSATASAPHVEVLRVDLEGEEAEFLSAWQFAFLASAAAAVDAARNGAAVGQLEPIRVAQIALDFHSVRGLSLSAAWAAVHRIHTLQRLGFHIAEMEVSLWRECCVRLVLVHYGTFLRSAMRHYAR